MSVRIATQNIHWPNTKAEKKQDILKAMPFADVIGYQEVYRTALKSTLGRGWDTLDSNRVGKRDIAMAWRTDVLTVINEGFHQIGKMKKGSKKTFAIAWIETDDTIYGSCHPPHGKYERENPGIKAQCATGIVEWVNAQTKPVVLMGDYNFKLSKDEHNIEGRTGYIFYGGGERGIDGFLVSPQFSVTDVWEFDVKSDHPVVLATVSPIVDPTLPPVEEELTRGPQLDAIEKALRVAIRNNRNKPGRLKVIRKMRRLLRQIKPTPKRTA